MNTSSNCFQNRESHLHGLLLEKVVFELHAFLWTKKEPMRRRFLWKWTWWDLLHGLEREHSQRAALNSIQILSEIPLALSIPGRQSVIEEVRKRLTSQCPPEFPIGLWKSWSCPLHQKPGISLVLGVESVEFLTVLQKSVVTRHSEALSKPEYMLHTFLWEAFSPQKENIFEVSYLEKVATLTGHCWGNT